MIARPRSGLLAAALIAAMASPAAAQFTDQLVQAPKLAAPERGSIRGALSGVNFTASEMARGTFRLPLPISAPDDRGPLQANLAPSYSPDGGLSEWGMGWSTELSIQRHALVGEIDFVHDEMLSPWGRLRAGNDGKLYPTGMSAPVRVVASGSDWIATSSDGTQYRFSAAAGVSTARGVYTWQLVEVTSLVGDRTTLEWTKNATGRPFLTRVTWGGRTHGAQYTWVPSYETIATAFVDHTTGAALDRRITTVSVSARDAVSGTMRERWHYQLGYRAAPFGPAFYLETVQRTFASGESQPATVYHYDLDDTRLPAAALERYTGLDAVFGAFGDFAVQPDHAAQTDIDADGQPDFENASALTQIQHTAAGWTQTALQSATGTDVRCRPSASIDNQPRLLARLTGDIGAPHVLVTRAASFNPVTSEILVCDRLGHPLTDVMLPGDWELGPNVRLVDIDRDRRPDLVRVSSGGIEVLHNDSDAQGIRFTALPRFDWSLDFEPSVSWLNDFDGDGNIDVTMRSNDGLWVLFGRGNYQWSSTPVLFPLIGVDGFPISPSSYQMSFIDANKDGLVDVVISQGASAFLFTNRGDSFREVPVDGFRHVQGDFGLPVVVDLTGRGNTEVAFPMLGTAYVLPLATPSTGLMLSADDGVGTVAQFRYARSAATANTEQRITVLSQLAVASSGYDTVTYSYSYANPVLHSKDKHLIGFGSVGKHSPLLNELVTFRNDDDVAGVVTATQDTDERTTGVVRFTQRTYDDVTAHGVRWLRPATAESGYRNTANTTRLSTTTRYVTYERDVCPTVTVTTLPGGQLMTTETLASVAVLPDELHCMAATRQLSGTHTDAALDFSYLGKLTRNSVGQVTQVTQYGPVMQALVLQNATYTPDFRLQTIGAPGRGTTTLDYDALGRLSTSTDPVGVIMQIVEQDPVSDAFKTLATLRPDAPASSFFRYDGKERLTASWDDVAGGSMSNPLASFTYQDATATLPGRIDSRNLADATGNITRQAVALFAADGTEMVAGPWLGDHYALGAAAILTRNTLTQRHAFVGTKTIAAVAALTSSQLRAAGTMLSEQVSAGFGHPVSTTTQQQTGVTGVVTTELVLTASELVSRSHEPGGFTAESAVDAAGRLIRKTDENAIVHSYGYDALGRLVRVDTPDGAQTLAYDGFARARQVSRTGLGSITYAYDPTTGLPTRMQHLDVWGMTVDASEPHYDELGRPLDIVQSNSATSATTTFDHDGELPDATVPGQLGRMNRVAGDGWARTTLFDPIGRAYQQHTVIDGWRQVTSDKTYRADGSVASETTAVANSAGTPLVTTSLSTTLDSFGRVSRVLINDVELYQVIYDAESRPKQAVLHSGGTIELSYDSTTHRRNGYEITVNQSPANILAGEHWEIDPRGLISAETYDSNQTTTRRAYNYDGRGALTRSAVGATAATYSYTASGLPDQITDAISTRAVHRTSNQLTVDGTAYNWDTAGRVVGKGEWTFTYGPDGQLAHAQRPGRGIDFVYDDANQRLFKRIDGLPMRADVADGVLTEDHFYQLLTVAGITVGLLDNGVFTPMFVDQRGTPFAHDDGSLDLASPYGIRQIRSSRNEIIDFTRLGWDPDLDVVRMGVRDYDAKLSQFLTPDPLYFEDLAKCQSSPLQCSLYGYASGNPITFSDPTGTDSWTDLFSAPQPLEREGLKPGESDNVPPDVRSIRKDLEAYDRFTAVSDVLAFSGNTIGNTLLDLTPFLGTYRSFKSGHYISGTISLASDLLIIAKIGGIAVKAVVAADAARTAAVGGDFAKASQEIASSALQAERLKASLAVENVLNGVRVGSGMKADPMHRAAAFVTREILESGRVFGLQGGDGVRRTLVQAIGEVNDTKGVFEYILEPAGEISHQRFIPGGQITGFPNQRVP